MAQLLEFTSSQGDAILVEVDELRSGPVIRGGRPADAIVEAGEGLEQVLAGLGPVVNGIVTQLRKSADWPDQVEVEFGVRLSADARLIIARAGGEANFRIAMTWSRNDR